MSPLGRVGFALLIALLAVLTWVAWTTFGDPPASVHEAPHAEVEESPGTTGRKPDRVRRTPREPRAGAPEETTDTIGPKRTLIVEVLEAGGARAADASVRLLHTWSFVKAMEDPDAATFADGTTGPERRVAFDITAFPPKRGWLLRAVGAAGVATESSSVPPVDGGHVRLTLVRDHPMAGRVLVRGGPPVAGASIVVWFGDFRADGRTDAEGRFLVRGVPPTAFEDQVQIHVLNSRGAERAVVELDRGPPPPDVQILVDPVCTITGICVDTGERPVHGATVTVGIGPGHFRAFVRTDQDGRFVLESPRATWALMAQAPGKELFIRRGVDCSVPDLDAGKLVLAKERTCVVRGIIHHKGQPLVGVNVTTGAGRGHATRFAAVKTDEQGRFELETTRSSWVVLVNGYVWSKKIDFDVPTLDVGILEGSVKQW